MKQKRKNVVSLATDDGIGVNFIAWIPESHFWTDCNQMLEFLKYHFDPEYSLTHKELVDYLRTGLENTLKEGYNIQKIQDDKRNSNTTEGPY